MGRYSSEHNVEYTKKAILTWLDLSDYRIANSPQEKSHTKIYLREILI